MVSVGTGRKPVQKIKSLDVHSPKNLYEVVKVAFAATDLGRLMISQVIFPENNIKTHQ